MLVKTAPLFVSHDANFNGVLYKLYRATALFNNFQVMQALYITFYQYHIPHYNAIPLEHQEFTMLALYRGT